MGAAVGAAVERAVELAGGLPTYAGGKSFGGRMTSQAAAESGLPGIRGLVFLGFPLHPAGRPGTERAEHLLKPETINELEARLNFPLVDRYGRPIPSARDMKEHAP